jgi:outer membrane lipoprotein-sorting protein
MTHPRFSALFLVLLFSLESPALEAQEAGPQAVLDKWLESQAQIQTWSADVLQTRTLKTLTRPLVARGRVWFAQPNNFRWQLGEPPRTVAVGSETELVILYPRLQRGERYAQGAALDKSWQEVLDLLEVGFPSDAERFHSRYLLLGSEQEDSYWRFTLSPRSEQARRLIETITLEISSESATLMATELVFPEGSVMRTDFEKHQINPELDEALFSQAIPEGFEVESRTQD